MLTFTNMRQQGLKPDVVSYDTVIDGLCKAGRVDDAMSQFQQMAGRTADAKERYMSLVDSGMQFGRKREAMDLFAAISANGLVPNIATYKIVMANHIKEGLLEESDNLILAMEKSGCAPDSSMLNAIVRSLLLRDFVRAITLLLTCSRPRILIVVVMPWSNGPG
ncbi:hypothetical protein PR202_gb29762 [Eleusine coracana subsp. coracana]|uniref:Pentatricopeptide repeat-containing protein n=1 Tax=Eleusine coracana subsp. coracana TaxID=191504 RepID=A0AAV5FZW4_ELECO|nr:hypothetical protein PR202_gb29762 [Eleusine coracana subsp. coracana]